MNPERDKKIVRTSVIGILANVFLAAFKAIVGMLSHSVAIVMDAVNNLSDAMSSVITIVGTKLAGKRADAKHPYGYGRIEYMSALIISVIVLYAGVTSFTESVKKIIHPETPDYSAVTLIIVAVGVLVKIVLGRYVKHVGVETDSDSLKNSGDDAINDSIISASTLAAAFLYIFAHISIESWLGAVISIVIIKSGIDMLRETMSRILGQRAECTLSKEIKKTACESEGVYGAYDLVLNDYGPDRMMGSLHVEVPDYYTADQLDRLTREITENIYKKEHVLMTAIGFYSRNTKNDEAAQIRDHVRDIVLSHDHVLQMHGFYVDQEKKVMRYDVVIDFIEEDKEGLYNQILKEVQEAYPEYTVTAGLDLNTSD